MWSCNQDNTDYHKTQQRCSGYLCCPPQCHRCRLTRRLPWGVGWSCLVVQLRNLPPELAPDTGSGHHFRPAGRIWAVWNIWRHVRSKLRFQSSQLKKEIVTKVRKFDITRFLLALTLKRMFQYVFAAFRFHCRPQGSMWFAWNKQHHARSKLHSHNVCMLKRKIIYRKIIKLRSAGRDQSRANCARHLYAFAKSRPI